MIKETVKYKPCLGINITGGCRMPLFTGISSLNRCEILALIDSFSLALSDGLNAEDLNATGNFLVAVGSVMLTYATLDPTPGTDRKTPNDK